MHKKNFKNIILFLFAAIISLTLAEVFLRVAHPYNDTNPVPIIGHDKLPYVMVPNTETQTIDGVFISINSLGLRDVDFTSEKIAPDHTFLVVGDSTTYGYGVDVNDTFVERLEKAITENDSARISFINAGHSGFNLIDYYNLLNELKNKLDFDDIIIGLMGNDYTNSSLQYKFIDDIGVSKGSVWDRHNVPSQFIKVLRNSAIYLTLGNAIKGFRNKNTTFNQSNRVDNELLLKTINNVLQKIKKFADINESQLYFIYLPTKTELMARQAHYPQFLEAIEKFAGQFEKTHFLNLASRKRVLESINEIYFKNDWVHPNGIGHKIYCDEILEFLRETGTNISNSREC